MNSAVFMKLFINLIISWFTSFDDIISNHALRLSLAAPHPHPNTVSRPMICIPVSSSTPIGKLHVDWCLSVWHPFHTYPVIWLWQNLYCFYKKKAGVVENWLFSLFLDKLSIYCRIIVPIADWSLHTNKITQCRWSTMFTHITEL